MKRPTILSLLLSASALALAAQDAGALEEAPLKVVGHRFLTLNTVDFSVDEQAPRPYSSTSMVG